MLSEFPYELFLNSSFWPCDSGGVSSYLLLITSQKFKLYKLSQVIHVKVKLYCNMYDVYLFNMLFTEFLLTQILEIMILMVNKLL